MNIVKNIFGRIWALWGLLLFISTMLVAMIFYSACFFLKDPAKAAWHRKVSRVWMIVFLNGFGCPLKLKGKANFKKGENYVVVCNHNSLMDIPVTTPFMPNPNKTIAKKSFAKVPVFGWIYSFGSVLLDRNNEASRRKSYEEMKKVLRLGLDMLLYPEGTRNRTAEPLKAFFDGAFRLAVDSKKSIIPVLLFNTKKILPATKAFYAMPHVIEMHFLPPVSPENKSAKELKEEVFQLMKAYYVRHAS
jgi:1-acyl-sn-glycerol-3-phosphate acyltransferase